MTRDVDESAVEYSMDFVEVSHLHGIPPVTTAPTSEDPMQTSSNRSSSNSNNHANTASTNSRSLDQMPLRTTSSWSPPKMRPSESSLPHALSGNAADRYQNKTISESTAAFSTNKENEMPTGRSLGSDPLTESVAKSFLASQVQI